MRALPLAVLCCFLSIPLLAQADDLEPVLFPVLSKPFPGAFGTLWTTEAWMLIDSDAPLQMFPLVDCVLCTEGLPRHEAFRPPLFYQQPGHPPGSILWISRDLAPKVAFSLSVTEQGGASAALPVVRESELRGDRLHLLDVPVGPGSRALLRIYDVAAIPGNAVTVRVYTLERNEGPLLDLTRALEFSPAHNPNFARPVTPSFAQLEIPPTFAFPAAAGSSRLRLRIEIVSANPGARLWAFVTVTDLVSQDFNVVRPE